jgi:hypothetical protein
MKNLKTLLAVAVLSASSAANAGYFKIDVGTNNYDVSGPSSCADLTGIQQTLCNGLGGTDQQEFLDSLAVTNGTGDLDSRTGAFEEFGFSQLLGTSIYNVNDGSLFGDFIDTNIPSILNAYGVTDDFSGTAQDNSTVVTLNHPLYAQQDIDALSPLAPPTDNTDNEGFLSTWDLTTEFFFEGELTASGPMYTGGYFEVFFHDIETDIKTTAFKGEVTGSNIDAANLDVFLNVVEVAPGFLFYSEQEGGSFVDVASILASGNDFSLNLDTNVNPPIPTADQLLQVVGVNPEQEAQVSLVRQSTLDGSVSPVSEPGTLAILGLSLLGFAASRRKSA